MMRRANWLTVCLAVVLLVGCGKGKQAEVDKLRKQGEDALAAKKYNEAIDACNKALAILKDDPKTRALLDRATKEKDEAVAEAARKAQFATLKSRGEAALQAGNFGEAIESFESALKMQHDDADVLRLLQKAKDASEQARKEKFAKEMKDGEEAFTARKYQAAADAFARALVLDARDEKAKERRDEALFQVNFVAGSEAADAKQWRKAVDALTAAVEKRREHAECKEKLRKAKIELGRELVAGGKQAMDGKDYEKAFAAARSGRALKADDPKLVIEIDELYAEAGYQKYMVDGNAAMTDKKYSPAKAAFETALSLKPGDSDARRLLEKATALWEEQQVDERFARAMATAKIAVEKKDWPGAIKAYESALKEKDGNSDAENGLKEAKANQFKQKSYDDHISTGKVYLTEKHPERARKEFEAALDIFPTDKEALRLLAEAEKAIKGLAAYEEHMKKGKDAFVGNDLQIAEKEFTLALLERKDDKDATEYLTKTREKMRQALYDKNMKDGRALLEKKDHIAAIKAFEAALGLMKNDREATRLRDLAKANLVKASYDSHMKAASLALDTKNYQAAVKEIKAALADVPDDPKAKTLLQHTEAAIAKASYDNHMKAARAALEKKDYATAEKELQGALNDIKGDTDAMSLLKVVQAGKLKASYARHMTQGKAALDKGDFAVAEAEAKAALADIKDGPEAIKLQKDIQDARKASYDKHMKAGRALLEKKDYAGAVKELEGALKDMKDDKEAARLLDLAKKKLGK
jgi:tetratricopeptide (TPR) repeat protein